MPIVELRRMVTGRPDFDQWVDETLTAIERALNVKAAPPLSLQERPDGISLGFTANYFQFAKSGGSGIVAASGSTPGSGSVTLYKFDGTSLATQGRTITAYNLSAGAVAANAWLIVCQIGKWWFVIYEDCGA